MALGLSSYLVTRRKSITALIPAFFGVVLGVCTAISIWWGPSSVLQWSALGVVSFGLLGTIRGLASWIRAALQGNSTGAAAVSKGVMALICAGYLGWVAVI